jgi:dimethylhistidine N-methyltransferase
MYAQALDNEFAREVRAGLRHTGQKTLPCRYLYDDIGSALFEAITYLPEYGLTRADARVIQAHAADLVEIMGPDLLVAELGSGTGTKTRAILEALSPATGHRPSASLPAYYPIDVSPVALAKCAQELAALADVEPVVGSYLDGLAHAAGRRAPGQALLVLFLGSTIGNFEPDAALEFLCGVRQSLARGDALLLGTDLVKPAAQLIEAYDDPTGVNAAFNLNLLGRINRELNADFQLRQFAHEIRYAPAQQRIEMHLRSLVTQRVHIPKADLVVNFAARETIWTESCHKFRPDQIAGMARIGGFRLDQQWIDAEWGFAENLLVAV